MRNFFCLVPVLAVAMIAAPTAKDVTLAQSDAKRSPPGVVVQNVAPEQGDVPGPTSARDMLVIEVVKGSSVERVEFVSGEPIAAADDLSVGGATDLQSQIELFKGGELVVLTVVGSEEDTSVAAGVDSVKRSRGGPTNLIPFRPRAAGKALRNGPTNLIPLRAPVNPAAFPTGPKNLIPTRPQVTEPAFQERPAKTAKARSPVRGAALKSRPANGGVLVESVEQGGPAWRDGLRRADVIAAANRAVVGDIAALEAALDSAGPTAVLQVNRGGNEVVVVLHR